MSLRDIASWIIQQNYFIEQYESLLVKSVTLQFKGDFSLDIEHRLSTYDLGYLLTCASFLSISRETDCQDSALRIAQHCLIENNSPPSRRDVAASILDTLANDPAIRLAEHRELLYPNIEDRLSTPMLIDWHRRSIENSIVMSDQKSLKVNRFQKEFWQAASDSDWISVSAPTSAGKSFIIIQWIDDFLRNNPTATIVYLVPTRALILQVENDLRAHFPLDRANGVNVSSMPLERSLVEGKGNIFVYTQERLHLLQTTLGIRLSIDVVVIDEAHKVGDRQRGVLLQQVIEDSLLINPAAKLIYASPFSHNPEMLLRDAGPGIKTRPILNSDVTVNQNLIWVSQLPRKTKLWKLSLCLKNKLIELGMVTLENAPAPTSKRLPFVAYAIAGNTHGNIIYINTPSEAEKAARQIFDCIGEGGDLDNKELDDLIELVKKTIHPSYSLATVLKRGVAFHYGNMPQLVRMEIERLFKTNVIGYLVCTSTLVEGVNMSCRNIFMRGPKKGIVPLVAEDFWNLAGRAGRWGKEFQGNVFCIDANKENLWENGHPPRFRNRFFIQRSSDKVLSNPSELIEYIKSDVSHHISQRSTELEYMFSYLVVQHKRRGSILDAPWASRMNHESLKLLDELILEVCEYLEVPIDIIERNPGISPIAIESLLNYFNNLTDEAPENLLPSEPASDDALNSYTSIFQRISQHLSADFGTSTDRSALRSWALALLVTNWMRGFSLARMISNRIDFLRRRQRPCPIPSTIREVMKEVEEFARFKAPKYLACYTDVLRHYLFQIDRLDLADELIDLNILLEFGVSQQTQISLLALGLSRTSAIETSELISADSLNETHCLQWLQENELETLDLPEIVKREIGIVLSRIVPKD